MSGLFDSARSRYWEFRNQMAKRAELQRSRTRTNAVCLCPICGWRGDAFQAQESPSDTKCVVCNARPRHRVLKLILDELDLPKAGGRVLHVSPKGEEGLVNFFKANSSEYLSIDKGGPWNTFAAGGAMKEMDLRQLDLPDASFNFVCCNHVLENIVEDEVAIREIHRVLAPGGTAALIVQIYPGETVRVERPSADDYFHSWHPGMDYFDRYRKAGFTVDIYEVDRYDRTRYGLGVKVKVPICTKPR